MKNIKPTSINNNIQCIVKSNLCSYCGTCIAICPEGCIELKADINDDFKPEVRDDCTNCGLCLKVCPGNEVDYSSFKKETPYLSPELGGYRSTFIGRANNSLLANRLVAGGGFVTALSSEFLQMYPDGLIQWITLSEKGLDYPPDSRLLDLYLFNKVNGDSIYIPSFANRVFKNLDNNDKRPIMAIGLPCQLYGLELLRSLNNNLNKRIFCTISLFCGLTVSVKGILYLLNQEAGCD